MLIAIRRQFMSLYDELQNTIPNMASILLQRMLHLCITYHVKQHQVIRFLPYSRGIEPIGIQMLGVVEAQIRDLQNVNFTIQSSVVIQFLSSKVSGIKCFEPQRNQFRTLSVVLDHKGGGSAL
jgi:hypothetical protein